MSRQRLVLGAVVLLAVVALGLMWLGYNEASALAGLAAGAAGIGGTRDPARVRDLDATEAAAERAADAAEGIDQLADAPAEAREKAAAELSELDDEAKAARIDQLLG